MSEVVDTNVVELKFDNRNFLNNVTATMMAVDALKGSLTFDSKSFENVSKAAESIDLSSVAANVQSLSDRFSTFGIVGMTAIQRITNEVMTLAGKLGGLITKPFQQIITGGTNRAANIAQAKFQLEGLFGKDEAGARKLAMTMSATSEEIREMTGYTEDLVVAMDAANYAVADTAYGLDSAAKAASVLATSGVDVLNFSEDLADANGLMRTEMQVALRSISGTAAMANASYDDIAQVFERISGNGRVMAIDLNSLASRGLNAAATLRDYLNEIGETTNATEEDIRDMCSKGKIDFMTFAKAMDNAYGEHAKDANNTFTGAFSNMKFALSKIGADFIGPLREKMVPLFNDLRLSINQVRKALNFKLKFPGLDEEVSIVEMFVRAITHLTEAAHDLFAVWMGGQDVMQKAITGFATITNSSITDIKKIFDSVTNGTRSSAQGINALLEIAESKGYSSEEIFAKLGDTLGETEESIESMCRNGKMSFEDFYNALSSAFGNTVGDMRINQLAVVFQNTLRIAINLASTVTSIVGPVFYALFKMFHHGITDVMGISGAIADFTQKLILSRDAQKKIFNIATNVFLVIKKIIKIFTQLASAAFKVIEALAPLLIYVLDFVDALTTIIATIVDVLTESKLLSSIVAIIGKTFQIAGNILINTLTIIIKLVGPAIKAIGEVFSFLARSIGEIDLSFIDRLLDRFNKLVDVVANGGVISTLQLAVETFFGAIARVFQGLTMSFAWLNYMMNESSDRVATICDRIITIVEYFRDTIKKIFEKLGEFIQDLIENPDKIGTIIGKLFAFNMLARYAQMLGGISKIVNGLGNIFAQTAILRTAETMKILARSLLEFAVAMVLISAIPEDKVGVVLKLFGALALAIGALTAGFLVYNYMVAKLNANTTITGKFFNRLATSLNDLFKQIGRAAIFSGLAMFLISLAGSLLVLFFAVSKFATMDSGNYVTGIKRIIQVVALLTASLTLLVLATKSKVGNSASNSVIINRNNGLMGAATTLLAILVVLKAFETIIQEYASMKFMGDSWKTALTRIAEVIGIITIAISLIGLTSKRAGSGLMGSIVAMLGFLVVLEAFIGIFEQYKAIGKEFEGENKQTAWNAMFVMVGVITVITAAIVAMGNALTAGGSSFKATIAEGLTYHNNSAKFIGIMFTMLSLALVISTVSSMIQVMDAAKMETSWNALNIILAILVPLFGTIAMMRNVKITNVIGLALVLTALAGILPMLSMFDSAKLLASAFSMAAVIAALGVAFNALSSEIPKWNVVKATFIFVGALEMMMRVLKSLNSYDYASLWASGVSMMSIMLGFAGMFLTISKAKFNFASIGIMFTALLSAGVTLAVFSNLVKDVDPSTLLSFGASMAILSIAFGALTRLMSGFKVINKNSIAGTFATLIAVAISLGILMGALVLAANNANAGLSVMASISLAIDLLIPMVAAMAGLAMIFSGTPTLNGEKHLAAIMAILAIFVGILSYIAKYSDVYATAYLLDDLGMQLLKLAPFIAIVALLAGALGAIFAATGGLGAPAFAAGLIAIGVILAGIAVFVGMLAGIVTGMSVIGGNPDSLVKLLSSLGDALDAMTPFIVKMSVMCTLLGLFSPLLIAGAVGLGALMAVITAFVGAIALVSMIGNPTETITFLAGLTDIMEHFNEFLGHFMLVMAITGAVAPLVAIGAYVFNQILQMIAYFVANIAAISAMTDVNGTILTINTVTEAMRSLTETFLVIAALGALSGLAIVGLTLIIVSLTMLLTITTIIGQIDILRNSILSGINTILVTALALQTATELMNTINNSAIVNFIQALMLIMLAPMLGLTKLALMSSVIFSVSKYMSSIGMSSDSILKGSSTAYAMIKQMYNAAMMIDDIAKANTKELIDSAKDIYEAAKIYSGIGSWVGISLARGVLGEESLTNVAIAGALLAKTLEEAIRDTLQIHSESPLFNWIGQWIPKSISSGFLSEMPNLESIGISGMDSFGESMFNSASAWGSTAGQGFIVSMEDSLIEAWNNSGINDLYQYFANGQITEHVSRRTGMASTTTSSSSSSSYSNNSNNNNYIQTFKNEKEYLDYLKKQEAEEESDIFNSEDWMPDFGDLSKLFEGLSDNLKSLGSIGDEATGSMSGLSDAIDDTGSSSSKTSKEIDKLKNKIDDIIEDYEERADKAKERANKDLFKGVDQQGHNFLDEISDIMKEYEKIYTNAVERTNSQDLFAEVSDNDESFAPETLLNNLQDQVDQINELNTIIGSLSGRIVDNDLRAAIANMDVDDLPQLRAMYRMSSDQLADYEAMYQEKVIANQNKIQNELSGNLSQLTGEYTNVASYVASDGITNVMLNNMQLQIDKVNEYNDTINSLMSRVTDMNLREAIATMGIDSLDELKRLNAMTDSQLDEYVAMYNQKIVHETTSIEHELSAKLSSLLDTPLDVATFYEAYKAGMTKISDYVQSDESGSKEAGKTAGRTIGEGVSEGAKESLSEEEAYENGKNYTEALARGMSDQSAIDFLEVTIDGVISMIMEALQNSYPEYKDGGIQVVTNLLAGINESLDAGFDETLDGVTRRILETFEECNDDYIQSGHDLIHAFCQFRHSVRVMNSISLRSVMTWFITYVRVSKKQKPRALKKQLTIWSILYWLRFLLKILMKTTMNAVILLFMNSVKVLKMPLIQVSKELLSL